MTLVKQAVMEKRAEMKDFITQAKNDLRIKFSGATVNDALREVMAEELQEMIKTAYPAEDQPHVRCDYIGTRAVKLIVGFEPLRSTT
jgi:hypothetical protein